MANIPEQYTTSFPGSLSSGKLVLFDCGQGVSVRREDKTWMHVLVLFRSITLKKHKLAINQTYKHYRVCLCFAKPSWSWSSTGREFQCPSGTPLPKDLQSSPQGLWGPFCYTCHRLHVSAFWLGLFFNCLCSDWPNIITLGLINGWYVITILFLKKAFT